MDNIFHYKFHNHLVVRLLFILSKIHYWYYFIAYHLQFVILIIVKIFVKRIVTLDLLQKDILENPLTFFSSISSHFQFQTLNSCYNPKFYYLQE